MFGLGGSSNAKADHGGYPATEEGRWQSQMDHVRLAEGYSELRAEVARLREALEPFARMPGYNPPGPSDYIRAAAALAGKGGKT